MASNDQTTIKELQNRLDWLDEERRKASRKLTEMEQKVELQEREAEKREQRIKSLEQQLASANAKISRIPQLDVQLAQFKDDIVQMIEQYDQRRIQSEGELDRLRRVEQESIARELADMRKEITPIPQLQSNMELRVAEENRLSNLIGQLKTSIDSVKTKLENTDSHFAFIEEKEKHNSRSISENQNNIVEINRKWEHFYSRLDTLNSTVLRFESSIKTISEQNAAIKESTKNWMEQIQLGEYERNQKLETWRRTLEEQTTHIEHFNKEWVQFSDQYKEAKMAVQTLTQWQEQIEGQQREAAESLRIESNRMQSRWDDFTTNHEQRWRNSDVDREQRWSTLNRHIREILEQLTVVEETITKIEDDKDLIWRVQTAQADALKQLPRLWMESVEQAIEQNPNRKRQPALVPVREEFD